MRRKTNNYKLNNNELYYVSIDKKTNEMSEKLVVHKDKLNRVLYICHDQREGHLGLNKTVKKISSKYYIPKMIDIVKNYISKCEECQYQNKKANTASAWVLAQHIKTSGKV